MFARLDFLDRDDFERVVRVVFLYVVMADFELFGGYTGTSAPAHPGPFDTAAVQWVMCRTSRCWCIQVKV
jgi:hypothetical protein